MHDFYLTLPSNTAGAGNTTGSYRINLPSHIDLEGEWEVGLSEIFYPNSWSSFTEGENHFLVVGKVTETYKIPVKRYEFIDDLLFNLNTAKNDEKGIEESTIKFWFKNTQYRVFVEGKGLGYSCVLSKKLQYMLGYDTDVVITGERDSDYQYAQHAPDMTGGFTSLLVYCDLISPQVVGDVNAQVIRVVNLEHRKFGESVEKQYTNPHYVPLLQKEFSSVKIDIKDDKGQPVPFEYGKVCVKLHFRKRRL